MRYVVIAGGWLWSVLALEQVTNAAIDFGWWMLLVLTMPIVGLAWLLYSLAWPSVFRTPRIRWLWLSVPAGVLGVLSLGCTHDGLAVRVRLCESSMREYAESVRENPGKVLGPRRVGLFQVQKTIADENQVMLHTSEGFLSSSGIAYRPDGGPSVSRGDGLSRYYFHHLFGPWWQFTAFED